MKKALMVLVVLFLFYLVPNYKVEALSDSFYVGEYLSGEYIVKINETSGKYEQMRAFRRKSDNRIVYCIELWEGINEHKNLIGYDNNPYEEVGIPQYIWDKIVLISYYGYGYQNHTDKKWIAITQFMIWKELSPESILYFTDTLNGKKINKYESEIAEINELIKSHSTLPSFNNQTINLRYKENYELIDTNNILNKYDIIGDGGLTVVKNDNILTVNKETLNSSQILLENSDKLYNNSPIIYVDPSGQDVLAAGSYRPIYSIVNFELPASTINLNKLDRDTNSKIPQGDALLKGSIIELLDHDGNVISSKEINDNSELVFENIGYGSYYLKEIKPGEGYLLNSNLIELEVNSEFQNINFYNDVIKEKVVFNKYTRNPLTDETNLEEGAIFSLYNSDNEKITTFKTDENGTYELTLPYGNYILKQDYGKKNHSYINDISISINSNGNTKYYNLYNEELTSLVKIINIDSDSNLPILESGAKFRIIKLDEEIKTLVTNDLGITDSIILSSGKYKVEQISSINNYEINSDIIEFEIDENTVFNKIDNNNLLEIMVPNNKLKSRIEVIKKTEHYLNDILVNTETNELTDISIYASQDIYSKDGIKIYEKDSLVTSDLYYGSYYIINPINGSKIELVLDTPNTRKVEIIEKIYRYEETENKNTVNEELKECEKRDDNQDLEEEIITNVPNTYNKQNINYFGALLIYIGFIINNKEKKDEKTK